jgi:hypothetical protein
VVWGAIDDQTDTLYLYSEHYRGEVTVPVHASAIKARGAWIPGVSDPAANNQNQRDGIAPSSNIARKGWTFHWPTTRWRRAFKRFWRAWRADACACSPRYSTGLPSIGSIHAMRKAR